MVKIHFLQKVLKKWSSFRKKIIFFSITGGGSGPYMEFSIIDFFEPFFLFWKWKIWGNFFTIFSPTLHILKLIFGKNEYKIIKYQLVSISLNVTFSLRPFQKIILGQQYNCFRNEYRSYLTPKSFLFLIHVR